MPCRGFEWTEWLKRGQRSQGQKSQPRGVNLRSALRVCKVHGMKCNGLLESSLKYLRETYIPKPFLGNHIMSLPLIMWVYYFWDIIYDYIMLQIFACNSNYLAISTLFLAAFTFINFVIMLFGPPFSSFCFCSLITVYLSSCFIYLIHVLKMTWGQKHL